MLELTGDSLIAAQEGGPGGMPAISQGPGGDFPGPCRPPGKGLPCPPLHTAVGNGGSIPEGDVLPPPYQPGTSGGAHPAISILPVITGVLVQFNPGRPCGSPGHVPRVEHFAGPIIEQQ